MNSLLKQITVQEPFQSLKKSVERSDFPITTSFLPQSLSALLTASICDNLTSPLVVVTAGPSAAEEMLADLTALMGDNTVLLLPPLKQHPFDTAPLASGPRNERTEALLRLLTSRKTIIVTPAESLLEAMPSRSWLERRILVIKVGDDYPRALLLANLGEAGYTREGIVESQGQFAVRGMLLDLYAVGHEKPVRIEFDGDRIIAMRLFDPSNQRTENRLEEFTILIGDDAESEASTFFDLIPQETIFFWSDPLEIDNRINQFIDRANSVFGKRAAEENQPWLVYQSVNDVQFAARHFRSIRTGGAGISHKSDLNFDARPPIPYVRGLDEFEKYVRRYVERGYQVWITAENSGEQQRLDEILSEADLLSVATTTPTFSHGFVAKNPKIAILTGHELLGRRRIVARKTKFRKRAPAFDRSSLRNGDLVVHSTYGIGRYEGMQTLKVRGQPMEALRIIYQDDVVLYVRVDQFNLVEKFVGSEGSKPHLSRIGTNEWQRTKSRTKKALADMADELIKLYSQRKIAKGHAFSPDTHWQQEMEASFDFIDTPDQTSATLDVKNDLMDASPMDRLLCGDVGFGKTEVAVRATFKVVQDDFQVAVLVPTTILAQQHYETFKYRLASYPVRVETISRFQSPSEQKDIVADVKDGKVDVVIGTHRLLSKDVEFKNLGLVVIDEEHRFGVRHKERLKQLRTNVDVLTMTATPIPRTLHMALMGARDTSQINTPPVDRLPIVTEVHSWSEELIRDAILQEIDRNGQVFFLHNRVESIYGIKSLIERLTPGVRCAVAHGQMPSGSLEKVMIDFMNQKFDVLICTTIIESGIDIPNTNTLIVNRADKFGLAQLYQIRGRIGRSSRQAYAYLLTPPRMEMTGDARRRLTTLAELTELGSGMKIALRDLEIRGAGNLLGAEQSGFINAVGFDLYTTLLEEAVREVKGQLGESDQPITEDVQIEYDGPSLLPGDYIDEGDIRYDFYRRIGSADRIETIETIAEELSDRFGNLPLQARNLIDLVKLKVLGRKLQFIKIKLLDTYLIATLNLPEDRAESQKIIGSIVAHADPQPVEFKMTRGVEMIYRYPKGDSLRESLRFLQRLTR